MPIMINFKKNQEIVYDSTFSHLEKGLKVRFVITKSKSIEKCNKFGLKGSFMISKDIYNLYRVETNGRKLHLLTSSILDICLNAIKYILEINT